MSADLLRRAAAAIRSDMGAETKGIPYDNQERALVATADWLIATAEAHDGKTWSDASPALAVARAYLGGAA